MVYELVAPRNEKLYEFFITIDIIMLTKHLKFHARFHNKFYKIANLKKNELLTSLMTFLYITLLSRTIEYCEEEFNR